MSTAAVAAVPVVRVRRRLSTVPNAAPADRGAAYLRSWRVLGYTGSYVPVDVRS